MSTGYMNRVIKLDFPEFSGPEDPVWVVIRNPKLMPPSVLSGDLALNPDGTPADMNQATEHMYQVVARLVVGWRVYDPMANLEVDAQTGELVGDQPLLELPATVERVKKLPISIINAVAEQVKEASNPQ